LQAKVNKSRRERVAKSNFRRIMKPSKVKTPCRDIKRCANSKIPGKSFDAGTGKVEIIH